MTRTLEKGRGSVCWRAGKEELKFGARESKKGLLRKRTEAIGPMDTVERAPRWTEACRVYCGLR
jgi:hypothetical protein